MGEEVGFPPKVGLPPAIRLSEGQNWNRRLIQPAFPWILTLFLLVGSPDNPLCFDFHGQSIFDQAADLYQGGAGKVAREDFGSGLADQRLFGDVGEVDAQCDDVIDCAPARFAKLFDPPEGLPRLKVGIASADNAAIAAGMHAGQEKVLALHPRVTEHLFARGLGDCRHFYTAQRCTLSLDSMRRRSRTGRKSYVG